MTAFFRRCPDSLLFALVGISFLMVVIASLKMVTVEVMLLLIVVMITFEVPLTILWLRLRSHRQQEKEAVQRGRTEPYRAKVRQELAVALETIASETPLSENDRLWLVQQELDGLAALMYTKDRR